jgi:hypothetical protein
MSYLAFKYPPSSKKFENVFRRFPLLLAILTLFLCNVSLNAQNCQLWLGSAKVDVVAKLPGTSPAYPLCPTVGCDEIVYEFWLRATNPIAQNFTFNHLSIVGKLNVNGYSSYVDVEKTYQKCSPSYALDQFSVAANGEVGLSIGDPFATEPTATSYTIDYTSGSALLFSVVVHAGVGETINWDPSYSQSPGTPIDTRAVRTNITPICDGKIGVLFNGGTNPSVTMPAPMACSGINFIIDAPATQIVPPSLNPVLPIKLKGIPDGTLIEELEVLVEVKTTQFMEFGNIQSDLFDCPFFLEPDCEIKAYESSSGGFITKRIHAKGSNITFNGANNNLLLLYFLGPLNTSIGDCAEITVKYVRAKINGACCNITNQPGGFNPVQFCWTGFAACSNPDFRFKILDLPSSNSDCRVRYRFEFDWTNSSQNALNFNNVKAVIRFSSELPLTAIENNSICTSGNCVSFAPLANSNSVYEVTLNLTNQLIQKGSGFDIVLEGTSGCVEGYAFKQSEVKLLGSNTCVPALLPPYTFGGYARCASRLSGTVKYKYTQECGDYTVVFNGQGTSCDYSTVLSGNQGAFSFCACQDKFPYSVSLSKVNNNNPLQNVSTLDLVSISKHLLNIQPFDDPFKWVAADADCDGELFINSQDKCPDIEMLRDLLLGVIQSTNAPSYKILNAIPPPPPTNSGICTSTESYILTKPSDQLNFWVVKTGDVNWNPAASPATCLVGGDPNIDDRSPLRSGIELPNAAALPGEMLRIPIRVRDGFQAVALQLELGFDPTRMKYQGFEPAALPIKARHIGQAQLAEEGLWRLAWHDDEVKTHNLPAGSIVGFLRFEALAAIEPNALRLHETEQALAPRAYDVADRERILYPIHQTEMPLIAWANPNPFSERSGIQIDLPAAGQIDLKVFGPLGNLLHSRNLNLPAGRNEIILNAADVNQQTGVFSVSIQYGGSAQILKLMRF